MKRHAWKKKNIGKRDVEKKGRQLHGKGGREGWRGGRDSGRGVREGLQAERHVNGERRASLTRSLARHFLLAEHPVQLLLCVFYTTKPPPLPGPPSGFFVSFFCGWLNWLKFIVLAEGF